MMEMLPIRSLLIELIAAEARRGSQSALEHLKTVLPGIEDGSFFQLDRDDQINKLYWLNGAYFGRGELERDLVEKGHLRTSFRDDFYKCLLEYQLAGDLEDKERKLLENNLAALVQRTQASPPQEIP